jgi:hypothetical protein
MADRNASIPTSISSRDRRCRASIRSACAAPHPPARTARPRFPRPQLVPDQRRRAVRCRVIAYRRGRCLDAWSGTRERLRRVPACAMHAPAISPPPTIKTDPVTDRQPSAPSGARREVADARQTSACAATVVSRATPDQLSFPSVRANSRPATCSRRRACRWISILPTDLSR